MDRRSTRKSEQLGMPYSKASYLLHKQILFHLVQKSGLDTCFRCGERISCCAELSIDHKVAWLYSADPLDLFFDLGNIGFSHRQCNSKSRRYKFWVQGRSGYKGVNVVTDKRYKKRWEANISLNGKNKSLGRFATPQEAARAYDEAVTRFYGDSGITNRALGLL